MNNIVSVKLDENARERTDTPLHLPLKACVHVSREYCQTILDVNS